MLKCLSCSRVGDDIGTCGSSVTCPKEGAPIDPAKVVVIHCDFCDITRAVEVETLTKRRDPRLDNTCTLAECKAFIVRQPAAKAPPKSSPIVAPQEPAAES